MVWRGASGGTRAVTPRVSGCPSCPPLPAVLSSLPRPVLALGVDLPSACPTWPRATLGLAAASSRPSVHPPASSGPSKALLFPPSFLGLLLLVSLWAQSVCGDTGTSLPTFLPGVSPCGTTWMQVGRCICAQEAGAEATVGLARTSGLG